MEPLHLLCDCSADCITFDFDVWEEYPEGYIGFSTWWSQNQSWRRRIKAAWTILRGKEYYFSEVLLKPADLQKVKDYISSLGN